jgi:hypothetical protein
MTLQFERKYSTKGSRAPCHVSFSFFSPDFSGFSWQDFRWTLSQSLGLLHMECDFAIALPYQLRLQDKAGIF